MEFSTSRFSVFLKIIAPFILAYLVYFSYTQFYVYPWNNFFTLRVVLKENYNHSVIPKEVDYLILGDSTGLFSIDPRQLSLHSYSASSVAESIYGSYKTLHSLQNIKINKGIVLTQSFTPAHYDEHIWQILVPSGEFNFNDINLLLCHPKGQGCTTLKKNFLYVKYIAEKMYLSNYALKASTKSLREFFDGIEGVSSKAALAANLFRNNGQYTHAASITLKKYPFLEAYLKYFQFALAPPPAAELFYLNEIIRMAKEQGTNIYFVITPMCSNCFNSNIDEYNAGVDKILAAFKNDNFKVLDGRPFYKKLKQSDYTDFNHLNEIGAEKFSKYLSLLIKAQ